MNYGIVFIVMSAAAGYAAIVSALAPRLVLSFIAFSMLIVSIAYFLDRPQMLLKRPDGRRAWWTWLLLGTYFGMVWLSYWLSGLLDRRAAFNEISPGIWLGRRLTASEFRSAEIKWTAVVDLAAELQRTPVFDVEYLSLAVLDGTPPTVAQFKQGIEWINAHRASGPILIHCAVGHGRSACLAIAWLVANNLASDLASARRDVQKIRPGVHLNQRQMERVEEMLGAQTENKMG